MFVTGEKENATKTKSKTYVVTTPVSLTVLQIILASGMMLVANAIHQTGAMSSIVEVLVLVNNVSGTPKEKNNSVTCPTNMIVPP